jgi:DNA-binding IclR family transcriptional regulator
VSVGVPFPLHAGASSKAFLAFLPREQIAAYLKNSLTRLTPSTIVSQAALRREMQEIRERGWARSNAERQLGAASAAAPVFDHLGLPVAVISVCGPAERFEAEIDRCAARLLEVTRSLSAQMGHRAAGLSGADA